MKIAVPIAALVAAIFVLYTNFISGPQTDATADVDAQSIAPTTDTSELTDSSVENRSSTESTNLLTPSDSADNAGLTPVVDDNLDKPLASELDSGPTTTVSTTTTATPSPDYPDLPGYEVGVADISEEEYIELVERLRNDPALVADLLNELRAETDPDRLKRLTIMLGATGSPDVLPIAEELVYSSDPVSRKTGLDLLSRIAPQNPAAYDIANSILGSEADPKVLVSTMNVLARPKNAGAEAKATAISQIMPLANHESVAVRRHSVSMLVRLTNDETLSPVLYNALSDSDASVRKAAAYAYVDYPYQTSEAVERLLGLIENPTEERGVRQAAMVAMSNMSPDEATSERINAAKIQMRDAQQ